MSRNRLTTRTAADMKSKPGAQVEDKGSGIDNDTAAMNNPEHEKNDPSVGEYGKGDPSAWAEDVNKDKVNKDDQKREGTGHAPLIDKHAAERAIASARKLEEKAVKAIIASQRMLPGATDEIIEKQAGILMHLPEEGLNATLTNQENLAKFIAKAAEDSSGNNEDENTDKSAADKPAADEPAADEPADDKPADDKPAGDKPVDKSAAKEKLAALKAEIAKLEKAASDDNDEDEDDAPCNAKKEAGASNDNDEDDSSCNARKEAEASDANLLDQIFSGVMPSPIKKGASKLSGMVKKEASSNAGDELSSLWSSAPDVKDIFN